MSGLYENLPFARGATYGATSSTDGANLEGKEFVHQDKTYGTGRNVKVRVVRNLSGATLLGKRLAGYDATTAGQYRTAVKGYAAVTADPANVIDEFLPSTGVLNNDLFYVVLEGPCLAKTDLAGGANNPISVGDKLHALTAATTGATTAGRVYTALFTGATSVLAGQIQNVVGTAMSAKTTANTNADILICAGRF